MIIYGTMLWIPQGKRASVEHLGFIITFLDVDDPRSAKEQFAEKYVGGWHPMPKFKMLENGDLRYPGDPVSPVLWMTRLRDEVIRVYDYGFVSITQSDGSFEVARMD